MSMVDPARYYGLPQLPTSPPPVPEAATASSTSPTAVGAIRTGLHQDPVFLLVALLFLAFLLARLAEHGLSLGFKLTAR